VIPTGGGSRPRDRDRRARALRAGQARPAVAAHARSVRDLGQRDHAAADPGRDGDPVLGALDDAVPDGDGARLRAARRCPADLGRARLLLARAEPVVGCAGGARPRRDAEDRSGATLGARDRAVHRRRDRVDRVRRARTAGRRQRRARARAGVRRRARHQVDRGRQGTVGARGRADDGPPRRRRARGSQPGPDGARRDRLRADVAALPRLSARAAMHRGAHGAAGGAAGRRRTQEAERAPHARAHARVDRGAGRDRARPPPPRGPVRRAVGAPVDGGRRGPRRRARSHARGTPRPDAVAPPAARHGDPRRDAPAACPGR